MRIQLSHNLKAEWPAIACSLGFALAMCGQMTAWALRGYTPFAKSIVFPAVPVLIALVLLVRSRWFVKAQFAVDKTFVLFPVLLLFFPFTALEFIDPIQNKEAVVYQAYLCILTILVGLNKREDFEHIPIATLIVGTIGCVAPLAEFLSSPIAALGRMSVAGSGNPLAVATNGSLTFYAALVVGTWSGKNSTITGFLAALAAALGASNVILSGTRSGMLAIAVSIPIFALLHLLAKRRASAVERSHRRNISFFLTLLLIGAVLPGIVTTVIAPQMLNGILKTVLSRVDSLAMLSSAGPHETSASVHANLMKYNWDNLDFWGHGINAQSVHQGDGIYAHNIFLQAFYDLGFVGGLVVLVAGIVIPVALIVLRWRRFGITGLESFIILAYANSQFDFNFHGTPYSWGQWLPPVLIYTLFPPARPHPNEQNRIEDELQTPEPRYSPSA